MTLWNLAPPEKMPKRRLTEGPRLEDHAFARARNYGVSKLFGRTVALRGVTLRADRGQIVALLGANGSGKTTLLKILAGAMTPTAGTVTVYAPGDAVPPRSHIGLLASETYLYDDLTAAENVRFTLTMSGQRAPTHGYLMRSRRCGSRPTPMTG